MRQLYYNRLTSHQNKNIVITTITILVFFQATSILRTADKESFTMYHGLGFGFLLIIGTYLLGLIPFEQVLESSGNKEFTTYYKFGRLKFKRKKWDKADKVFLEQDEKRFYCLKIVTVNGQTLQFEKYPTLDKADERLTEFKRLFD